MAEIIPIKNLPSEVVKAKAKEMLIEERELAKKAMIANGHSFKGWARFHAYHEKDMLLSTDCGKCGAMGTVAISRKKGDKELLDDCPDIDGMVIFTHHYGTAFQLTCEEVCEIREIS